MEQIRPFGDDRLTALCYLCHGDPATRDHVPPRVFLDEPYPENLPVVGCCRDCNEGASQDEEYVACLLEAAACGTGDPSRIVRGKISRILTERPALASRISTSFGPDGYLAAEWNRVLTVVDKIGRALWTFESGETTGGMLTTIDVDPIANMSDQVYKRFLEPPASDIFPEVGSRMMIRAVTAIGDEMAFYWQEVQAERFSYAIDVERCAVKLLIRAYLAVEVRLTERN